MKKRVRIDLKDSNPKNSKESRNSKESNDKGHKNEANAEEVPLDDDTENQGFSEWLRSSNGVELMRLFVIANSLVVFVTMAWPNMQEALSIVKDMIMGEEEE